MPAKIQHIKNIWGTVIGSPNTRESIILDPIRAVPVHAANAVDAGMLFIAVEKKKILAMPKTMYPINGIKVIIGPVFLKKSFQGMCNNLSLLMYLTEYIHAISKQEAINRNSHAHPLVVMLLQLCVRKQVTTQ